MANLLDRASVVLTPTAYNNGEALCIKPDDGSGDFTFSRNSAATRVNAQGLVENVQILSSNLVQNGDFSEEGVEEVSNGSFTQEGSELITNGDFATDSNWNKLNSTISGGKGNLDGDGQISMLWQSILTQNKSYKATFTVSNYNNLGEAILMNADGTSYYTISTNGTFTIYFKHITSNGSLYFRAINGAVYSIDNVSVREVGQDWTLGGEVTIGDNLAHFESNTNTYSYIRQDISSLTSKTYKIQLEVKNYVSGAVQVAFSGASPITQNLNVSNDGVYTAYLTPNANGDVFEVSREFNGGNFNFDITNISVKEVGQNWSVKSGEVLSVDSSGLVFDNSTGNGSAGMFQNIGLSDGKTYTMTATMQLLTGPGDGNFGLNTSTAIGSSQSRVYLGGPLVVGGAAVTETFQFTPALGDVSVQLFCDEDNSTFKISNISVIEITNDTSLPRINYEGFSYDGSGNVVPDSGCGSWLFEPQSTNLIPYSEDFSQSSWSKGSDISIESGYLAPDGNNTAYKVTKTGTAEPYLARNQSLVTTTTRSIYARSVSGTGTATLLSHNSNTNNVFTLTEQWQRFELNNTASPSGLSTFYAADFRGSGTLTEYLVWGANATNDQDYATSYIPSNGSQVTRNQDVCTNGGSLASINSTEGTLYFEGSALANDGTTRIISLSDGTTANRVNLFFDTSNTLRAFITGVPSIATAAVITDNNKVALKFKSGDISVWLNGTEVATSTSTISLSGLSNLSFNQVGSSPFFGKTKALAVWKEALSDAELTELTTI